MSTRTLIGFLGFFGPLFVQHVGVALGVPFWHASFFLVSMDNNKKWGYCAFFRFPFLQKQIVDTSPHCEVQWQECGVPASRRCRVADGMRLCRLGSNRANRLPPLHRRPPLLADLCDTPPPFFCWRLFLSGFSIFSF